MLFFAALLVVGVVVALVAREDRLLPGDVPAVPTPPDVPAVPLPSGLGPQP